MPSPNEAARNVHDAVELARAGNLGKAFRLLRGQTSAGDDYVPSPGDDYGPSSGDDYGPSSGDDYPSVEVPGYEPHYPYVPPIGQAATSTGDDVAQYPSSPPAVPAGWYVDPFDGVGLRWWNGFGWTGTTQG